MNVSKRVPLLLSAVISTTFFVSCTHVFEGNTKEIDLSVFKNVEKNIATHSQNKLLEENVPMRNSSVVMDLAINDVTKDIVQAKLGLKRAIEKNKTKSETRTDASIVAETIKEIKIQNKVVEKNFEIRPFPKSNIDLIEHNGFNGKIENKIDFEALNWELPKEEVKEAAKEENNNIITDTIQTASAKSIATSEEAEDDLQVFEYSENAAIKEPKIQEVVPVIPRYADAKISDSVLSVIKREIRPELKAKNIKHHEPNQSSDEESMSALTEAADSITSKDSSLKKPDLKNAFIETPVAGATKIEYQILARTIEPGKNSAEAFGFEFIPHYERNERTPDSSGEIKLEYSIVGSQNVVSGLLLKHGHVDTQIDLDLDATSLKTVVPLIETEKFESFLQKNKLSASGSYILVNMTKGYFDVEVDGSNAQKIILNSKFMPIKKEEKGTFIFVSGVSFGNNFVRLKTESGWTQKIINNQENMITYIDEETKESSEQTLELYTESKSGKLVELNVASDKVKLLSSKNQVRKISTNKIMFKTQETLSTQKNYLEITKESPVFVGVTGDELEIQVPTQREKELIMTEFGLNSLEQGCIIQINSGQDIQNLKVGGPAEVGEVFTQVLFGDKEGNLSTEISEWTNKAYIYGDRTGVMNIQVEYSSGGKRMTNTYCSNDVYLLENF